MVVRKIVDEKDGRMWKIVKRGEDDYVVRYYEYFRARGWVEILAGPVEHWSKEAVEWEFGVAVA